MPDDPLLRQADTWRRAGERVAIATVVETWGSAPCPAGSRLVASETGRFAGSVSAGCVEAAVLDAAHEIMEGAAPRLLSFGVEDERAWEVGLTCGGRLSVWVEALA